MSRRSARNIGILFAASIAFPLITATSASADTGAQPSTVTAACQGPTCEGKWPDQQGCDQDARTPVPAVHFKDLVLELRYSPACRAAWGRITSATPGDRVRIHSSDHSTDVREIAPGKTSTYTVMVNDAGLLAWASARDKETNETTETGRY
jgi:hypothetical protein